MSREQKETSRIVSFSCGSAVFAYESREIGWWQNTEMSTDLCIFSPQNERARYTIPEFLLPHESSIPVVRQEDSDIEDEYEDDTTQGKRQRYGRGGRGI